jgi:hypothetical protein
MARCSAAGRTTAVPTTARGPSLYATAAIRPVVREIGVFNTTSTATAVAICRASATGTQGAGLTEVCETDDSRTVIATAFTTHTADATLGSPVRQAAIAATIGAGVIFTFGDNGLIIDNATTAGVTIAAVSGVTGQNIDFWITWDE